jgi:site-specific DNA-cytosine methylase
MSIKHATIIPLIGGETLGSERAFGTRPEYFLSYEAFWGNDRHIVNYYNNEVPYYVLDKNDKPHTKVDVIGSVCPCAGLSQMSHGFGDHNENNKWLIETTKYVLGEMKPEVYWGENAPGFAGKIGDTIRTQMYNIGRDNGYSMTVYRTRSLLHGVPQVRERSFYFFWKGDKTPQLNYYDRPHKSIEQTILNARGNTLQEPINPKTPSKDPFYRYILEELNGGMTHREFSAQLEPGRARGNDTFAYIEKSGKNYREVAEWMTKNGYEREAASCVRKHDKLAAGGSIMRRGTVVPKDYIGAFVGHYPTCLTHPVEDRYITYREGLTIMGHPDTFELLEPSMNTKNHICQNVPVQTAEDMATEVREYLLGNRKMFDSTYTFQYNYTKTHEFASESNKNNLAAFLS